MQNRMGVFAALCPMDAVFFTFLKQMAPLFDLVYLVSAQSAVHTELLPPNVVFEKSDGGTGAFLWKQALQKFSHKTEFDKTAQLWFLTDDWYGPFGDADALFAENSFGKDDAVLLFPQRKTQETPYLLGASASYLLCDEFAALWQKIKPDTTLAAFSEQLQTQMHIMPKNANAEPKSFPLLAKNIFDIPYENLLCDENGTELDRIFSNAKQYHDSFTAMCRALLAQKNIYDLKQQLPLNFVFSQETQAPIQPHKTTALFAFLHYQELFAENLNWISKIPAEIDVYLITDSDEKQKELQERVKNHAQCRSDTAVLCKENRGRDVAALLLTAAPILQKYEIFGFVHDKKTAGAGKASIGASFQEAMMHNLLASTSYIRTIIATFYENPALGLLASPPPIHARYFAACGNSWTHCFSQTQALAQRLELHCNLDESKQAYVLGTAFWARTAALKPLFAYPWNYDCFSPEPLPQDGTIHHAIERIFPYVAQSEGYLSGWVMTAEYAARDITNKTFAIEYLVQKGKEQGKTAITTLSAFPTAVAGIGLREAIKVLRAALYRAVFKEKNNRGAE
ncbi:MAG: rhamnan synthesis F family protein [Ruthenibacterium sp.]